MVGTVIAAASALAAAGSFGLSAVLQHRQARKAAGSGAGGAPGLRLLADPARRPAWLAGIGLAAAAYGLQGLALAFGPLSLAAPIVATDLLRPFVAEAGPGADAGRGAEVAREAQVARESAGRREADVR